MYSRTFPRNTPSFYICSPPSGGRFWYRVPSKEQGKGPPERTKRSGAFSRTEDASGAAGAAFGTEYLFRTVEAYFEHRVPLMKTPSVQKKGVFMHRMPFPYRRSLFFTPHAPENAPRTPGSLFEHGAHIPYHRRPSPVPNANHPTTQPPSHHSTPSSPVPNARHRGKLPPQRSLAYILVDLFLLVPVYDYRFGIGIELLFRFVERLQKRVSGALVSNGGGRTVSRVHLYRWVEKYDLFHY